MTAAPENVVLPVGGVIVELIPSAWVSLGENSVHLLDEQQRRHWRRPLLGGVVFRDLSRQAGVEHT